MRYVMALLIVLVSCVARAEYTNSCGLYAQMLWSASTDYESAKSDYDSACDPTFGFSRRVESACGAYGYVTSSFKEAKTSLEGAQRNAALFCGICDDILRAARRSMDKETAALRKDLAASEAKIKALEAENEELKKGR
jgi:flagellar motility protein MotE (MotC chaperone)